MYIAVCDDEKGSHETVKILLADYMKQKSMGCNIKHFFDGEDLTLAYKSGEHFDLILLDVIMDELDGISAAKEIRTMGLDVPIIFLTSSRDFAIDGYSVSAISYMLKPVARDDFFVAMDKFLKLYRPMKVRIEDLVFRVCDLVYAESANKKIVLHFLDNSTKVVQAKFEELITALNFPNLLHCHRCYVVNLDHIKKVEDGYFLTVTDEQVLIRQKEFTAIKKAYFKYILSR